jgi:hypothetical protein
VSGCSLLPAPPPSISASTFSAAIRVPPEEMPRAAWSKSITVAHFVWKWDSDGFSIFYFLFFIFYLSLFAFVMD